MTKPKKSAVPERVRAPLPKNKPADESKFRKRLLAQRSGEREFISEGRENARLSTHEAANEAQRKLAAEELQRKAAEAAAKN